MYVSRDKVRSGKVIRKTHVEGNTPARDRSLMLALPMMM